MPHMVRGCDCDHRLVSRPENWEADLRVEEVVCDIRAEGDVPGLLFIEDWEAGCLGVDFQEALVVKLSLVDECLVQLLCPDLDGVLVGDLQLLCDEFADSIRQFCSLDAGCEGVVGHFWGRVAFSASWDQYFSSFWCFAISSSEAL